jgi:hypothetical protein
VEARRPQPNADKVEKLAGWQDSQEEKKQENFLLFLFLTILPSC